MNHCLLTSLGRSLLAPSLALACFAGLPLHASDPIDWKKVDRNAPEGLQKAAQSKRNALILSTLPAGENVSAFLGFFIAEDGTAICPLEPLCQSETAQFQLAENRRKNLEPPEILAILPEQQVAVVKFDFTPEETLSFAGDPTPLGAWGAILAPSSLGPPCLGPIVAHRPTNFTSLLRTQIKPVKRFSFAMNRNHDSRALIAGAPILNAEGEVIAIFTGTLAIPGQVMRFGDPTLGLEEKIAEAVEENDPITLPFPEEENPLDPAQSSEEWTQLNLAKREGDNEATRKSAEALATRFPDSAFSWTEEYQAIRKGVQDGTVDPEALIKCARRFKAGKDAPDWKKGISRFRLAQAQQLAGQHEKATSSFEESNKLYPEAMACANLAAICESKGQIEEAENYWRQATELEPDRIFYWESLKRVLNKRRQFVEAVGIDDSIYLLRFLLQ